MATRHSDEQYEYLARNGRIPAADPDNINLDRRATDKAIDHAQREVRHAQGRARRNQGD